MYGTMKWLFTAWNWIEYQESHFFVYTKQHLINNDFIVPKNQLRESQRNIWCFIQMEMKRIETNQFNWSKWSNWGFSRIKVKNYYICYTERGLKCSKLLNMLVLKCFIVQINCQYWRFKWIKFGNDQLNEEWETNHTLYIDYIEWLIFLSVIPLK